ncbi:MAG TPA: DUF4112 domain-containing protein [Blastocatellia bacterium]|nr:DUF4112 domain-containing protein [Blastocatellia bacterium]
MKRGGADRIEAALARPRKGQAPSSGAAIDDRASIDPALDKISFILDQAIRIPGTDIRFGIDPIISLLLPAFGDAVSALLSLYIVFASVRYGLPKIVTARMIFNIGVDMLIGSVPLIGDLFDFAWKANQKNMRLLNRHARGEGRARWSDWGWLLLLVGVLGLTITGLVLLAFYAVRSTGLQLF